MKYPSIEDLTECPHCGDDYGYYQVTYAFGHIHDNRSFKTGEPMNTEMYDSLSYGKDSDYFCISCEKKIATVKSSVPKARVVIDT